MEKFSNLGGVEHHGYKRLNAWGTKRGTKLRELSKDVAQTEKKDHGRDGTAKRQRTRRSPWLLRGRSGWACDKNQKAN